MVSSNPKRGELPLDQQTPGANLPALSQPSDKVSEALETQNSVPAIPNETKVNDTLAPSTESSAPIIKEPQPLHAIQNRQSDLTTPSAGSSSHHKKSAPEQQNIQEVINKEHSIQDVNDPVNTVQPAQPQEPTAGDESP